MILLDTSGLLAALDSAQRLHSESAASLAAATAPLLLSPFVLAELDYLLATRVGHAARTSLLGEVHRGALQLEAFSAADVRAAAMVIERHADLAISLADASIVVLAARHRTQDVLTLDQRHFRVLAANGKPFRVLPADC
ncbi:MAG: PIN domain-containing protein [Actinomycetota bacterium]|nr:PIN domain-containing protein [Actinomycetota bacterium]